MFYTRYLEISLALQWDSIIIIELLKFETNLKMYIEIRDG